MLSKGSVFRDKNGMVAEVIGYRKDRFNTAGFDYQTKYTGSVADYWVDPNFVAEVLYEAPPELPEGVEFNGGNTYYLDRVHLAHQDKDSWTLHVNNYDDYVEIDAATLRKLADTIDIVDQT